MPKQGSGNSLIATMKTAAGCGRVGGGDAVERPLFLRGGERQSAFDGKARFGRGKE